MTTHAPFRPSLLAALLTLLFSLLNAQVSDLEAGFITPPDRAKPRTWLHAMSGNMSKEGMTKDLESIAAVGQGGVLLFNVANGIPYGDVPYGSDEHHHIIAHAAAECERLNLTFGVHNCDGWTSSGGPWITPEQSMKKIVWSDLVVDGGDIEVKLPQPTVHENYYGDLAVLAYPSSQDEITDASAPKPKITSSDKDFDPSGIVDGSDLDATDLRKRGDQNPWVMFDYGQEREIGAYEISYRGNSEHGLFEVSTDGKTFTKAGDLRKLNRIGKKRRFFNDTFDTIKARYFRFTFFKDTPIREIKLSLARPYHNYLGYSGLSTPGSYTDISAPRNTDEIINPDTLIDLTDSLDKDGVLRAKLPEGKWTILRFGYTSTGATNWPASKWGVGLECDKFSRPAFKIHFDAFSKIVIDNTKKVAPNAMQYLEIDSYEMGGQNWTDGFFDIFKNRKGYQLKKFLPLFAGRIVKSPEAVAGVAYDLNEVYCDLMTENYFKYCTELCHENGIQSYVEPYGSGPVSPLDISEHIDLPMTEFWMGRKNQKRLTGTIHGAHIYGKNIISAEAFTARPEVNWKNHPAMAKTWGDMSWVAGVNEFMFHRFVHQANTHLEPGLTMGFWGSHFDRTQTWWMNAGKEWFSYHARGSHLLRHGYHAADVLVFSGDIPHKDGFKRKDLSYDLPLGLNFDCTNARALRDRFTIKNQALVLPEGNAYRYLILEKSQIFTLPTLRRIKEIIDAGIPVIGKKPKRLAGYAVTAEQNAEFNKLCDEIWSQPNCHLKYDFSQVRPDFEVTDLKKGFIHRKNDDASIYFFYNETEDPVTYECNFRITGHLPELWNATTGEITKLARFKAEEDSTRVWLDLEGLESAFVVFREEAKDIPSITKVEGEHDISLKSPGVLEILTDTKENSSLTWSDGSISEIPASPLPAELDLSKDWTVEFLARHHFASKESFPELTDWKDHAKDDIKYYSGTAIYEKSFELPEVPKSGIRYILDLGSVDIVAEVSVNGQDSEVLWIKPFEIDITDHLKVGTNHLKIKLTNQWSNRLIGDENYPNQTDYKGASYNPKPDQLMPRWYVDNQPLPAGPRVTFDAGRFYKKGDELQPSGLKGPVKLKSKRILTIRK